MSGISRAIIRDLMTEFVEQKSGECRKALSQIRWLADNGSIYAANENRRFAKELGLESCTTQAYRLESNGMAQSFVKIFQRDYVRVHDTETGEEVLLQLRQWFEEYKNNRSHKGLRMLSPREFRSLAKTG